MGKLGLFVMILLLSLGTSCATRGVNNIETGMRTSNTIYADLVTQVSSALRTSPEDDKRGNQLRLANQKLEEYIKAYAECSKAVYSWKSTGQAPVNMIDLYAEMWRLLLDAQNHAATVYIYASECAGNTTLKGKACKN